MSGWKFFWTGPSASDPLGFGKLIIIRREAGAMFVAKPIKMQAVGEHLRLGDKHCAVDFQTGQFGDGARRPLSWRSRRRRSI